MGLKQGVIENTLGEHIGNLGNILGTWREQSKKGKNRPPPTPKTYKKSKHFECMLSLPIGCMKFLFSKTIHHHFWPMLIPPLYIKGIYSFVCLFLIMFLIPPPFSSWWHSHAIATHGCWNVIRWWSNFFGQQRIIWIIDNQKTLVANPKDWRW
jgi:hypothetical protein